MKDLTRQCDIYYSPRAEPLVEHLRKDGYRKETIQGIVASLEQNERMCSSTMRTPVIPTPAARPEPCRAVDTADISGAPRGKTSDRHYFRKWYSQELMKLIKKGKSTAL